MNGIGRHGVSAMAGDPAGPTMSQIGVSNRSADACGACMPACSFLTDSIPMTTPQSSSPSPRRSDTAGSALSSLFVRLGSLVLLAVTLTGCGGRNLVERITSPRWGFCGTLVIVLDIVALVDVIGDDGRSTGNKVIWSLLIIFMPILGVLLYFFLGKD